MSSNILLFGTGGVGCIYAALLEKGGATVTCVCRSNYEAVKQNGILVKSKVWPQLQAKPRAVRTTDEAQAYGPFDYILVCSKAFPGISTLLRPAVTPHHTAIALAQNGIDIEDEYATLYPHNPIISGVVYLPTTQTSPGVVSHNGTLETLHLGPYTSSSTSSAHPSGPARTDALAAIFTAGGATTRTHDARGIAAARWHKLASNAALNPTAALTLCDDGNLLRAAGEGGDRGVAALRGLMREVAAVAAAAGFPDAVPEERIEGHLARYRERMGTGGIEPSMLMDVRAGRPMEVEAIVGNVVRRGEALGVAVPGLQLVYVLAKAREFALEKGEGWMPIATGE